MFRLATTSKPFIHPQSALCFSLIQKRTVKTSIVDWKPIRSKNDTSAGKKGFGSKIFMGLLVLMPIVSFGLGTWQVRRLQWKTDLIAQSEYRLSLQPLPLPPKLSPDVVNAGEFDYRRVIAKGTFRHDQEMLVGPRMHEGREGFFIVTPLERKDGSKLLIHRGWIPKSMKNPETRGAGALPTGEVQVECLLQKKPIKNMFTPDDAPREGRYHFMNIDDMAKATWSQPIYIQALYTDVVNGIELLPEQMSNRGIPIGAPGKVDIRNTHFQYILTWYGLSLITTLMLFRLLRQGQAPSASAAARKLQHAKRVE